MRLDVTEFGPITNAIISWVCGDGYRLKFQLWITAVFGLARVARFAL
jgi:hypothetical protein